MKMPRSVRRSVERPKDDEGVQETHGIAAVQGILPHYVGAAGGSGAKEEGVRETCTTGSATKRHGTTDVLARYRAVEGVSTRCVGVWKRGDVQSATKPRRG